MVWPVVKITHFAQYLDLRLLSCIILEKKVIGEALKYTQPVPYRIHIKPSKGLTFCYGLCNLGV